MNGKKRRFNADDFFIYLAKEILQLPDKVIDTLHTEMEQVQQIWKKLVNRSFLPEPLKARYQEIVEERARSILLQ